MKMTQMHNMTFELNSEGRKPEHPPLFAYLVGADGAILETQSIGEKGTFKFKAKPESLHGARILIAPKLPDKNPNPTLDDLRDLNAYEPSLKFDSKAKVQQIASVPIELWPKWHFCLCRVRGRVEKDFCYWLPNPFCLGFPFPQPCPPWPYCFTLPVCPARVHICRIKPRFIFGLPASDILRIRTDLLAAINPPSPPDPIGPIASRHEHGEMEMPQSVEQRIAPIPAKEQPAATHLSPTLRFKLRSDSPDLLRRALSEHLAEIKPLIPYFDWCSLLYTCQEIAVVDVDDHGRFDTWFFHDCGETNDFYFWVEYLYNTQWVTIYRPSLCSGGFWNYLCGFEVVLKTTDSRVSGCRPITGRFLEITRVGTSAWLPLVDASTGFAHGLDFGDNTHDATGATISSGTFARPFGTQLGLSGNFGFNLPDANLATHYRVSSKPSSTPDNPRDIANWTIINTPLSRAYNDTIDVGGGASKLVTSAFELKDPTFPDFYRIPKENADQQAEIPQGADLQDRRWATDEFTIAVLNTEILPPDTYDLQIELCRPPAPAAAPQPISVPREVFEMPDPANFNQSTFCDDAHLIQSPPGGPNALAFRMRLAVDTRHCASLIADAAVDGTVSDPECGILPRGSTLRLAFTASHPRRVCDLWVRRCSRKWQ